MNTRNLRLAERVERFISPDRANTRHNLTIGAAVGCAALTGALFGISFSVEGDAHVLALIGSELGAFGTAGLTHRATQQ